MIWDRYESNILQFCSELMGWGPGVSASGHLLEMQRGYRRIGMVGEKEDWKALAAMCIWTACVYPTKLQIVVAGTTRSGLNWVEFLRELCKVSHAVVRSELLFAEGNQSVYVTGRDEPAISVVSPALVEGVSDRLFSGRPTILVMPDFDKVPTKWYGSLHTLVSGPEDQWLTVLAPSR